MTLEHSEEQFRRYFVDFEKFYFLSQQHNLFEVSIITSEQHSDKPCSVIMLTLNRFYFLSQQHNLFKVSIITSEKRLDERCSEVILLTLNRFMSAGYNENKI